MASRLRQIWDNLLLGGGQVAVAFLGFRNTFEFTTRHIADDGWILSAISGTAMFIASLIATYAGVGALPFWRTTEGKRFSIGLAVRMAKSYKAHLEPIKVVSRIVGGIVTTLFFIMVFDLEASVAVFALAIMFAPLIELMALQCAKGVFWSLYIYSQESKLLLLHRVFWRRLA